MKKIRLAVTAKYYLPYNDLLDLQGNFKTLSKTNFEKLKAGIINDGFSFVIHVWKHEGRFYIIDGHQRVNTIKHMVEIDKFDCPKLPVAIVEADNFAHAKRKVFAASSSFGKIEGQGLYEMMQDAEVGMDQLTDNYDFAGVDMEHFEAEYFKDTGGGGGGTPGGPGALATRFVVPPFSILDTRQGYWKTRKENWLAEIKDNGESRQNTLDKEGGIVSTINDGVSILDPVIAELACKWFAPKSGSAFDCFAGDTVFGYVASKLGYDFTGIELRHEQVKLNNERCKGLPARYICDDAVNLAKHIKPKSKDLLFSCPPYFDLEVYSDLPNDASNQASYTDFLKILDKAFTSAVKCLRPNRFAVVVVGDVRAKDGAYYDFPSDISQIFKNNGMQLYNSLILVEPVGTARLRAAKYMANRKVAKTHQNVLVFFKGNISEIGKEFAEIVYEDSDLEGIV